MPRPAESYKGTCELCGKLVAKSAITRHMAKCVPAHDLKRGKKSKLLELRVQAYGIPYFWLQLEVKSNASLRDLDQFLRDIWLECCGHLSQFIADGTYYEREVHPELSDENARSMSCSVGRIFAQAGDKAIYEYDYGSTTALEISVVRLREAQASTAVRLLARNEPPIWVCGVCGEPATQICTDCVDGDPLLCDEHAETHECGEEMLLPVVNSPRAGVCGYTGPQ